MRNKIFTFLGILVVLIAVGAYFLFDANVKQNSQSMGFNALVAKANIADGTVIKDVQQANELFGAKKITQADAVPSAIKVNVTNAANNGGIVDSIKNFFVPSSGTQLSPADLNGLVGKKITTNVYKNEQVLSINLASDPIQVSDGEKYYDIPVTYTSAVGGEVKKGDYVDLWIHYDDKSAVKPGASEKVVGPLKVVKVKDANNIEITGDSKEVPNVVVFKMSEQNIELVSQRMHQGELFLTKWGVAPTSKDTMKAAQNAETPVSIAAPTK